MKSRIASNPITKLFIIAPLLSGCLSQNENLESTFEKNHIYCIFTNDTISYPTNWKLLDLDYMNEEHGFVARFVDYSTKSQYIVKNKIDSSDLNSFNSYYYAMLDSIMLNENTKNQIIDTSIVKYRGALYNKREYLMYYGLKGWYKQVGYSQYDSNIIRSVQMIFKINGPEESNLPVPNELIELDNRIKIN